MFTPDGSLVVVASTGPARFWEVGSGKAVDKQCKFAYGFDIAVSPDGKLLAFAKVDCVEIWGISRCERTQKLPSRENPERIGSAASVAFSPDGKSLAASYWGKGGFVNVSEPRVHVWDTASSNKIFVGWKSGANVWDVSFSPDGTLLAAVDDVGQLRVWNFKTQDTLYTIQAHKRSCYSVGFSPDGTTLATCSSEPGIKFWNVANGKPAGELKGHTSGVRDLAFSPDGKLLVSGGDDNLVMIWPLKN